MTLINNLKILIVDDNNSFAETLRAHIKSQISKLHSTMVYDIKVYESAQDCISNLDKDTDLIIFNSSLGLKSDKQNYSSEELLKIINGFCADCKVIMIADEHNADEAVELFRLGIYEHLIKDEDTLMRLSSTLKRAIRDKALNQTTK